MLIIDAFSFGHMSINGKSYQKDVIIFPDGSILCPWWRESGHKLAAADIQSLIEMRPEIVLAGTGSPGLMKPESGLQTFLQNQGIDFVVLPTKEAVRIYNDLSRTKRTGGCFHLTC